MGDVGSCIVFHEDPVRQFFCTHCVLQRMYVLSVLNHHGVAYYYYAFMGEKLKKCM